MGEVFRALDTRLNRPVAIKQSHGPFSDRFHSEARAISALNHPNVCTLYDVGPDYLVMELVEGDTLAARLSRGNLSLDQAVRVGVQVAEALAAAHAKGIVHRDLKPANIMLAKTGAKVLDFGLAKVTGPAADTVLATQGIVGTPAYMAPEQLAGGQADARTDIFALGLVLHEAITGRRVLVGHGVVPAFDGVPERLAHVVERCLAVDPDSRWHSAHDVARELEWAGRRLVDSPAAAITKSGRAKLGLAALLIMAAGLSAGAFIALGARTTPASPPPGGLMRTAITLPVGLRLDSSAPIALSPDGAVLAMVAEREDGSRELYIRPLGSRDARALAGTAGAEHPFFSPDGRAIGFFAGGYLQRIDLGEGATPYRVCQLPGVDRGATWGRDGTIVFAVRGRGLFKVLASGGTVETVGNNLPASWPSFLPDGKTILYSFQARTDGGPIVGFAVVSSDGSGQRAIARLSNADTPGPPVLGAGGGVSQAVLSSEYLVYGQDPGVVRALPVDPTTLVARGASILVGDSAERGPNQGGVAFAASPGGLLAFVPTGHAHELVWVTRQGIATPVGAERDAYRHPTLSPDAKTIAVSANDETRRSHVWLVDVSRGSRSRIATGAMTPAWTPDGRQIVLAGGGAKLTLSTVSGSPPQGLLADEQFGPLLEVGTNPYPTGFSPDGRTLLIQADAQDIWKVTLPERRLEPVMTRTDTREWGATVSSAGTLVAYVSDESGRPEVYVARWPDLSQKTVVSVRGGIRPRWSHDGSEVFYWQGRTLMAARITPSLQVSMPQPLFTGSFYGAGQDQSFDVTSDGRFLMIQSDPRAELREVAIVQNWMTAAVSTQTP